MKKQQIRKMSVITVILFCLTIIVTSMIGCKASQVVSQKTGVQLWTENCQRCHNTPSPSSFSAEQWETIGMHMQTRALLTNEERDKIVEFLKQ
ncbi:MAG TPA: cytochrome c [Puia sp.]|nr:cytochrome c [Puia sp.]